MPKQKQNDFLCVVCHETVRDCETTTCCHAILCVWGGCELRLDKCPVCRIEPLQCVPNPAVQRLANDIDVECAACGLTHKHTAKHWCPKATTECHFNYLNCSWVGRSELLESHLSENHCPLCPHGHQMQKIIETVGVDHCNICGQEISESSVLYECIYNDEHCEYVECPSCFAHRPIWALVSGQRLGIASPAEDNDTT